VLGLIRIEYGGLRVLDLDGLRKQVERASRPDRAERDAGAREYGQT